MSNKKRLLEDAKVLIERQSGLSKSEKEKLVSNVEYFMSIISRESMIKECYWEWFKESKDDKGLNLVWDWKHVRGKFGINTNNSYDYSFSFGKDCEWCGGDDGKDGFCPNYDVEELIMQFYYNHLID